MELAPIDSPYPLIVQTRLGVHIHSCHFIYLRDPEASDEAVLDWLGIHNAELDADPSPQMTYPCLWISRCAEWVHVADDLTFTLCHRPNRMAWLEKLSQRAEVFMTMAGDCDPSYAFARFVDGALVRAYEVESPDWSDRVVRRDEGDSLSGESAELHRMQSLDLGFAVAASLGIDVDQRGKRLTKYALDNALLVDHPSP